MERIKDILFTDLTHVITALGQGGGRISPSIYDTAQALRFYPNPERWQTTEWLLSQQQADGGWGDMQAPLARDVPTMAAILALDTPGKRKNTQEAIKRALIFLRRQASQWTEPLPNNLPVGIELLLPQLLAEGDAIGLKLPHYPYVRLIELGRQRSARIKQRRFPPATPPIHSWEGWGTEADTLLFDAGGSIGHSPAATAAWLKAATANPATGAEDIQRAQQYLKAAAAATNCSVPGVVPTVWPINLFELSFGVYALLLYDLFDHPRLQAALAPQIRALQAAITPQGIGMSEWFLADGDDTAVALAILKHAGLASDPGILRAFEHEGHYCAYAGEFQASMSVTAHAIHALALHGQLRPPQMSYVLQGQRPDGCWSGDKWNHSWLYTTSQVIAICESLKLVGPLSRALDTILAYQQSDGGWGTERSVFEETAYAVLALRICARYHQFKAMVRPALAQARSWMLENYRPFATEPANIWQGKESYRPERISRMFELCALTAVLLDEDPA